MKRPSIINLAAAAAVLLGCCLGISCKKDNSSAAAETRAASILLLRLNTDITLPTGQTVRLNDSILEMFDIAAEVTAGADRKSGTLAGDSLRLEAVATAVPSQGEIKVTVTPKASFTPDTTKKYTFGLAYKVGFTQAAAGGSPSFVGEENDIYYKGMKGSYLATHLDDLAALLSKTLSKTHTFSK